MARAEVERLAAALTRFDAASELCALNADPTLLGELERAGYGRSLAGRPLTPLASALRAAPDRRAASPNRAARWRAVRVGARTIERPPGLRLDLGGSAKGFIADRAAALLAPGGPCAVDCGGDIRVHGPHAVHVRHPLTSVSDNVVGPSAGRVRQCGGVLELTGGGVATSGVDARAWGGSAHHLLDPSTGEPAWTGVVSATALAPTAAEAEARAKAAVLSGPRAGLARLWPHGGVLVRDDGSTRSIAGAGSLPNDLAAA